MAEITKEFVPFRRRRTWYLILGSALLLIAGLVIWTWIVASHTLQADRNLHALRCTIHHVEQFVHENKRWPNSWGELELIKYPSHCGDEDLPAQLTSFKRWVEIDFEVDIQEIIQLDDPLNFQAIKPIGPCYEYRDYGDVESLQETLKQAVSERSTDAKAGL